MMLVQNSLGQSEIVGRAARKPLQSRQGDRTIDAWLEQMQRELDVELAEIVKKSDAAVRVFAREHHLTPLAPR